MNTKKMLITLLLTTLFSMTFQTFGMQRGPDKDIREFEKKAEFRLSNVLEKRADVYPIRDIINEFSGSHVITNVGRQTVMSISEDMLLHLIVNAKSKGYLKDVSMDDINKLKKIRDEDRIWDDKKLDEKIKSLENI